MSRGYCPVSARVSQAIHLSAVPGPALRTLRSLCACSPKHVQAIRELVRSACSQVQGCGCMGGMPRGWWICPRRLPRSSNSSSGRSGWTRRTRSASGTWTRAWKPSCRCVEQRNAQIPPAAWLLYICNGLFLARSSLVRLTASLPDQSSHNVHPHRPSLAQ